MLSSFDLVSDLPNANKLPVLVSFLSSLDFSSGGLALKGVGIPNLKGSLFGEELTEVENIIGVELWDSFGVSTKAGVDCAVMPELGVAGAVANVDKAKLGAAATEVSGVFGTPKVKVDPGLVGAVVEDNSGVLNANIPVVVG